MAVRPSLPRDYNYWYASGAEAKVFLGNVWIDDLVSLQFDMVEQKAPLYGYASEFFDGIARGTKIVQGVFAIAFKRAEYIQSLLASLKEKGIGDTDILGQLKAQKAKRVAAMRSMSFREEASKGPRLTSYSRILDQAKGDDTALFEALASSLEEAFWGPTITSRRGVTDHDKVGGMIRRGFDLLITYGNPDGDIEAFTTKLVEDCHITGTRQQFGSGGDPILEVYTFFGKSMDPSLTTFSKEFKSISKEEAEVMQKATTEEEDGSKVQANYYFTEKNTENIFYVVMTIPQSLFDKGWRFTHVSPTIISGALTDITFTVGDFSDQQTATITGIHSVSTTTGMVVQYGLARNGSNNQERETVTITVPLRKDSN